MDKVVGTYELLEAILHNCQVRQLYVLRSVNSTWLAVIERSENLQKKMFLLVDGDALSPVRITDLKAPEFEERLLLGPAFHTQGISDAHTPWVDCKWMDGHKGAVHDGLRLQGNVRGRHLQMCIKSSDDATPTDSLDILLTQPPITAVVLWARYYFYKMSSEQCTIYNPKGLTVGDIFDVARTMAESGKARDPSQSFEWWVYFFHSLGSKPTKMELQLREAK